MRWKRLLLVLPALAAGLSPSASRPAGAVNSVLLASPQDGHSGDVVYLSGSGLRPYSKLAILVACPNWADPHAAEYHNYWYQEGPVTDSSGEFKGFRLNRFHLNVVPGSVCTIYSNYTDPGTTTGFGPDIPALYTVHVPDDSLPRCARVICAQATARPKRVRAGYLVTIDIRGQYNKQARTYGAWAGAQAQVTVQLPHQTPLVRNVRLNWEGVYHLQVRVPGGASDTAAAARVQVHFTLGSFQGSTNTTFTVVR